MKLLSNWCLTPKAISSTYLSRNNVSYFSIFYFVDLQDLCKKLSEKDEIIAKLQEKCNETVDVIQREFAMEKSHIERDKESTEVELRRTKYVLNLSYL